MREHTIVTISRQYGSGGREVAEILAKKMQVRCYDRQIVYLAAEKIGNGDLDVESILEEAYKVPGSHSGFFGGLGIGSDVIPDYNKMYLQINSEEYSWDAVQMQYLQIHRTVIISSFMQTMHLEKKEVKKHTRAFP